MTSSISFPDGTHFTMTPDETYRWVSAYGATFVRSNGSQDLYRAILESEALLVVNTHNEDQHTAIEQGNRRYQESIGQ